MKTWQITPEIRIHRLITKYVWSWKWDPVYTQTFQQAWKCLETGEIEWRPIPIITEDAKNITMDA